MNILRLTILISMLFFISSCADFSTNMPATPLPANETLSQYMNPRGYTYPVVDRVCDNTP